MNELKPAFNILKKHFPDYEHRPQQMKMSEAVFSCLKDNGKLLVEAGTGVGKSFAYLIPAILSNKKTVVSTASIALQDQLINKDLTFLQKTLPQKFSFAMLKGKNNYLCLKREREFSELTESYMEFREWMFETETGDKDELSFIPDFWSRVCGESNDCSSTQCPFYGDCFYYSHFRGLYKKDIIVVNHHLLMYDVLSGFNVLPFREQLIIDEAHRIENVISHVFGSALGYQQVMWLLYRLRGLKIAVDHLFKDVERFFKNPPALSKGAESIPAEIIQGLKELKERLALDKVIHRLNGQMDSADSDELRDRTMTTVTCVMSLESVIHDFIERDDGNKVYYLADNKKSFELKSNLVESQEAFKGLTSAYESVIMTSATLTAAGDFNFIKERLGITSSLQDSGADFNEMIIGSPFNYSCQALLYLDKELPAPDRANNEIFQRKSVNVIERLINASSGRSLVLFTSYSHLRYVSENVETEYPFKSQGDMPPARLIEWFRKTGNSVLFATATFWQGIDIKGDDLSLVILVKIPFGSPGEPVYDERCRRLGDRWFTDLALPSAILQLRQGFGRLIRSYEDRGVVAMLDSRLLTSSYGRTIISSLPEMDIVHSVEDVKNFFESLSCNESGAGSKSVPSRRIRRKALSAGGV